MNQPIGESNVPYFRESGGVQEMIEAGMKQGYLIVKAQTLSSGDVIALNVRCVADNDSGSYSVTSEGRKDLEDYKKYYRPFNSENDNLWSHVLDYFKNTRGLVVVSKIDIFVGTPVYGHVQGTRLIGDGITNTESRSENWVFQASYPWGTPGNIKSWTY
jgi:hypothetical protein